MPKKRRGIAARQAAVSRERKRRKRSREHIAQRPPSAPPVVPVAKPPTEATETPPAEPSTVTVTHPPPGRPQVRPTTYRYLIPELRKIAIITAVMIVILIALAFVLG